MKVNKNHQIAINAQIETIEKIVPVSASAEEFIKNPEKYISDKTKWRWS